MMLNIFKKLSAASLEDAAVKNAIAKVIDQRSYHTYYGGFKQLRAFESALSERFGGIPVLGVNSGTDALVFALKVLGISPGDEVIAPALSFISTVSCIPWVGAVPAFVDIRAEDYAMDPSKVEKKITKKTKAIIVAHLFGQPATGISEILAIAKKHDLPVIEDAAQSFGAKVEINGESKMAGAVGDIGCFSFSSTKPLAAPGNGGAILIHNSGLREETTRMRFYGGKTHYYDYPTVGVNSRLHEIQAAALLAKLRFLGYWLNHRSNISSVYTKHLDGVGDLHLPRECSGTSRTWYRYVIRTKKQKELFSRLEKAAGTVRYLHPMINYPVPLPYFSIFGHLGHKSGDFPVADQVSQEVISLPISNDVSAGEAEKISEVIKDFFTNRHVQ